MSKLRLPDFRQDPKLNALRALLQAPLVDYEPELRARTISLRDTMRLATTGITVEPNEIETLSDGTFTYQGVPVLLYIFAPAQWADSISELPRYHLCNCRTWSQMKASGRSDRYVASTRVDGLFELSTSYKGRGSGRRTEALQVCQNCLEQLKWDGFTSDKTSAERRRLVQSFSLDAFFQHYKRSPIREKPRWTPATAPSGSYSDTFDEISSTLRAAAGWRCQQPDCGRLLSSLGERRYLHVHHRNGVKGDNRPENLTVVCLECHAKEPSHQHMRRSKEYADFMRLVDVKAKSPAQSATPKWKRNSSISRGSLQSAISLFPEVRSKAEVPRTEVPRTKDAIVSVIEAHLPVGTKIEREILLRRIADHLGSPLTKTLRSEVNTTISKLRTQGRVAVDDGWHYVWRE